MILLLLCQLAFAHGGEDHGAPAPPPAATLDGLRLPLSSPALDAVLVLPGAPSAAPAPARLLVTDADTSAPISLTSAALDLSGPAAVKAAFSGQGGVHEGAIAFPEPGAYAGSLLVEAGGAAHLFGVTGLQIAAPGPAAASGAGRLGGWLLGGAAALLAVAFAFGAGLGLGRWQRGAGVGLIGLLALSTARVSAHGGEDHGAPLAAAATPGAGLSLPIESQLLLGLRTVRVALTPFAPHTLGLGALTAAPGGSATLRAPTGGTLEAPAAGYPAPGSLVRAGAVLALLRETPSTADRAALGLERAEAGARLAERRAALTLAERDLAQVGALGEALSERERLTRQAAVDVARVAVREAERRAGAQDGLVAVTAPLSGRLALGAAGPGDQVSPGDELFHVVSDRALWVSARVPEAEAGPIVAGGRAEVTLPAVPGRSFPAIVLDGGVASDPATGTVRVTLALEPDPALRPGLSASAWIAVGASEDVITVPDDAVVESNGAMLVFVKTGPERFEAREVALGARSGQTWEVHAGLQPAERVVVAGTYALKSLAGR